MQNIKIGAMIKKQTERKISRSASNNVFAYRVKPVRASYIYLYVVELSRILYRLYSGRCNRYNYQSYDGAYDSLVPFVSSDSVVNRIVGRINISRK